MATLLYLGHGSFRLVNESVIYIDPYAGEDYSLEADVVLMTHQHHDHHDTTKIKQKEGCLVLDNTHMLRDGVYQKKVFDDFSVEAVEAYNDHHKKEECVGYLVNVCGKTIYFVGDTSLTEQMKRMPPIDYAFLPTDGHYNMDNLEAKECVKLIKAKHTFPIHNTTKGLLDIDKAKAFGYDILLPGDKILL